MKIKYNCKISGGFFLLPGYIRVLLPSFLLKCKTAGQKKILYS